VTIRLLLAAALSGCVAEHDPDVYVALPDIEDACATLDAAHLAIEVSTIQGERFTAESSTCQPRLAGQGVAGFQVELFRLTDGYHRLDAHLLGSSGGMLGALARPFSAAAPLVIGFGRADLPGWPRAGLTLVVPACTGDPGASLHVTAIAAGEPRPVVDAMVPCAAPHLQVPRGAIDLVARIATGDGRCVLATASTVVRSDASISLTPAGSCP
jgi:hypothetical protein